MPTELELNIARKIVKQRVRADFKRISDKEEEQYNALSGVTIPQNMPKLPQMTDDQLQALKQALEESLGKALVIQNDLKRDYLKVDAEITKRL